MTDPEYVPVVAAVIEKDGMILLAKRKSPFMGYHWEFPGGAMKDGETLEECVVRELRETFGINGKVGELISGAKHVLNCQAAIVLYVYRVSYLSGNPSSKSHEEFRWVNVSDLLGYDFSDAQRHIVGKLATQ
jgi:8-oxo-dGTP diphosphatase